MRTCGLFLAGLWVAAACAAAGPAAEGAGGAAGLSAREQFAKCALQPTHLERNCLALALQLSEQELAAAEAAQRADLRLLERDSRGSAAAHPVRAFDGAARAYRSFRTAEAARVAASYGSGNGGGVAAIRVMTEMNIARAKRLRSGQ